MAGGDVRVGRRAVSSDTARGVPRKRNVSGGCGGSWKEARVAVVVVIWYEGAECGHGPTKGTLRSSLLWVPECGAARLSELQCPFPYTSALPDIACTDGRSQLEAVDSEIRAMNAAGGVRGMRGDKVEVVLYIRIRGIAHVEEGREEGRRRRS